MQSSAEIARAVRMSAVPHDPTAVGDGRSQDPAGSPKSRGRARGSARTRQEIASLAAEQVRQQPASEPETVLRQAMEEVADQVNAGALDGKDGIRTTMTVSWPRDTSGDETTENDQVTSQRTSEDTVTSEQPSDEGSASEPVRKLVRNGYMGDVLPDQRYPVPSNTRFDEKGSGFNDQFIFADDLALIADALIDRRPELDHLSAIPIAFRWKATGGASGQAAVYGECKKLSGPLRHTLRSAFLITLSADHLFEVRATYFHVEAILYHELLHIGIDEDEKVIVNSHDFTGFRSELKHYGLYRSSLERTHETFVQAPLWGWRDFTVMGERGAMDVEA